MRRRSWARSTRTKQEAVGRGRDHEEIGCDDLADVIPQERAPRLRGRRLAPPHVLGDAGLPDLDAQFEQFTVDPWCPPTTDSLGSYAGSSAWFRVTRSVFPPFRDVLSRSKTVGTPGDASRSPS